MLFGRNEHPVPHWSAASAALAAMCAMMLARYKRRLA